MQNRSGWFGIDRKIRARIFKRIDDHKGPGRPPRKDLARLLVFTIVDHAAYADVPERNRQVGVWRTTYAEVAALTALNKGQVRKVLMYLKKQGLIKIGDEYGTGSGGLVQGQGRIKGRVELVITALFYKDLTTVEKEYSTGSSGNKVQVINNPPSVASKKKRERGGQEHRNYGTRKSRAARPGCVFFDENLKDEIKPNGKPHRPGQLVKREPMTIHQATEAIPRDLVPCINEIEKLDVEEIFPTQLEQLKRLHKKLGAETDELNMTPLHRLLRGLSKTGRRFESIPDILEILKEAYDRTVVPPAFEPQPDEAQGS